LKHYLIIQSQDPFTLVRAGHQYHLARSLHQSGNKVSMLLVQDGVSVALHGCDSSAFETMLNSGVRVFADRYALAERNIDPNRLRSAVQVADMDLVATALIAGDNVIWH
jgi:predicted peroxiredoxin